MTPATGLARSVPQAAAVVGCRGAVGPGSYLSRYCVRWLKPRELPRTVDDRPAALDARPTVALGAAG